MKLILHEIKRLEEDYHNCDITYIKELIISDIKLLSKALFIYKYSI